ncbi:hypothetical protein GGR54DRAFT_562671 [Hypoxylon sp. NC1633]|nr:hypothetical protein GGR54DRAFT_562671 [Hypoxylon sp. NC1633]
MGRKPATICRITDLRTLIKPARLQITVFDSGECVASAGSLTIGELVVFFEIDFFLLTSAVDHIIHTYLRRGPDPDAGNQKAMYINFAWKLGAKSGMPGVTGLAARATDIHTESTS